MPTVPTELQVRRARDADLPEMARIHHASFPSIVMTLEERISYFRNDPRLRLEDHWVCERKGRLVGMFALYNFRMQRGRTPISVGGIGMVAVAPEARRQKIAYWMMLRAVQIMDQNNVPLSSLYPFSHGFYHKLGWGVIGKTNLFRFPPGTLPAFPERVDVVPVRTYEDQSAVMSCYEKFASEMNGLLVREEPVWFERIFKSQICYAYKNAKNETEGYLVFQYRPLPLDEHLTAVDVKVNDFVWLTDSALKGLIGFLAAQSDQARAVIVSDQTDLPFEHIVSDPLMAGGKNNWDFGSETAWVGSGLMGRIVNFRRTLSSSRLGPGSGRVTFQLKDELNPQNEEPLTVDFEVGKATFPKGISGGVSWKCDVAVMTSIWWGALKLAEAKQLGLVELGGDGDLSFLSKLFALPKPICYDYF